MRKLLTITMLGLVLALAVYGGFQVEAQSNRDVSSLAVTPTATRRLATPTRRPPTPTPQPPGLVESLDDVEQAVVQIEAQGKFVNPAGEATSGAGRGSGFIIDPSGLAVTNNHVVGGAALLKVWVAGESRPKNARVLGVSECSDLAVIDIEGGGYPYLGWFEGRARPGLDVYAAGFPLGEPEYTLTRGIVSKERAGGETNWASVDSVIEHDATINPGNSGGPLITEDGLVVGVNYRGREQSNQYYAIGRAAALPVIDELRRRHNVDSIGINPEAVAFDSGLTGVWASSVQSGSPADKAGIKAGDVIVEMEGLPLGADGSMADYCDILRTHEPEDTLDVRVVRFATQEVWEGQLNGRPLEQVTSFAEQGQGDVGNAASGAGYENYVRIEDDSGALKMEAPEEWDQVDGSAWKNDAGKVIGAQLLAQPSGATNGPFVLFSAAAIQSGQFDADALLDQSSFKDTCGKYEGRDDYADQVYTGRYDQYSGCGPEDGVVFVVAAAPEDESFFTLVMVMALTEADLQAADRAFSSFEVVGRLPGQSAARPRTTGGNAEVTADTANVRAGPGTNYAVVTSLRKGDRIQAVGRTSDSKWVKLDISGAPQAWIASQLVSVDGGMSGLVVAAAPAAPAPAAGSTPAAPAGSCPSYLRKPKAGQGVVLIENHIGEPLHIDKANTTQKWDVPAKKGDVPGRVLLDLPAGHNELVLNTPNGEGTMALDIKAGVGYLIPIVYDQDLNVYPLAIPASCK